jgi:tRNA-specific 2-thiouridylase
MSGGVDSSVAAALLLEQGHDVTGVTLKLWGGESDSGCCSVADVEDARRVAAQLGIRHYVFNLSAEFDAQVVGPYVDAYVSGATPNPCVDCNRYLKWGHLFDRADRLGFTHLATGHHARVAPKQGRLRLLRGRDPAKDQSYVLARLDRTRLDRTLLPVGELTKDDVRRRAAALGLRTASKPESMDVCFITRGGRTDFIDRRVPPRPGVVVAPDGTVVGRHDGVRRFTVGQRRGVGVALGERTYVTDVDAVDARVTIGRKQDLYRSRIALRDLTFVADPVLDGTRLEAQCSAHGSSVSGRLAGDEFVLDEPRPRVAPGQLVAFYDGDEVVGAATAGT